jgi:hypothetical protein
VPIAGHDPRAARETRAGIAFKKSAGDAVHGGSIPLFFDVVHRHRDVFFCSVVVLPGTGHDQYIHVPGNQHR